MTIKIDLIDQSTRGSAYDWDKIAHAIQTQIRYDVAQAWGTGNSCTVTVRDKPLGRHWPVYILDNSDEPGALGYHETDPNNPVLPVGKVFVKTDEQYGLSPSVTLSHECVEIIGDPMACNLFQATDTQLWAVELCLTGDTRIALLNGTEVAIRDLEGVEEFWVYSCDDSGRIVAGRGHGAHRTRTDAQIVAVELDNGEVIRCTPDHPFMLRDGSYCKAGDLLSGASLMPLYRRHERMRWGKGGADYEQVMNPAEDEWRFTHQLVRPECPAGHVRHHVDFDRFNNEPSNLLVLTAAAHRALHQDAVRAAIAAGTHYFVRPQTPEHRAISAKNITDYNQSAEHREAAREVGREAMRRLWADEGFRARHSERSAGLPSAFDEERRLIGVRQPHVRARAAETAKLNNHVRWHQRRGIVSTSCEHCAVPVNHKVVSVTDAGREDVWDITVDGHHNFALSAGVFVHNCDPCEADNLGYEMEGVLLSDFVTPAWFFGGPGPYTYRNTIPKSRQLAKGGYQAILNAQNVRWSQVTAESEPGITSRARTMGSAGRLNEKRELLAWARAVPQPGLTMPDGS